ncbi:MAG: hypothetical protein BAA04_12370 [Firmicutes bacterium ZCTH02-B6]|nr:MAG: hypothetical protein BAA04_12370 [Firmicutes bacterium ZCTH02-B6]
MARRAVGIEVNEEVIRIVVLRRTRRGPVVEARAAVSHGGAVEPSGVVTDTNGYLHAFQEALERARAGRLNLCIAVASQHMDVRELELPIMPQRDLEHAIRFELANVTRFGTGEDLAFDYVSLPGDQQRGRRRLLALSAPRRVVRSFLDPLYAAAIYPEVLEMGPFALPWVCPREGGVCYLHTGAAGAYVLILEAQEFRLARRVNVDLTPLVRPAVDNAQGPAAPGADPLAVKSFEELAVNLERTLDFHRVRRRAAQVAEVVDGVVVSGDLGRDLQFVRDLEQRLGIPVTPADPIVGPGDARAFGDEAPVYALACGMGARGLATL